MKTKETLMNIVLSAIDAQAPIKIGENMIIHSADCIELAKVPETFHPLISANTIDKVMVDVMGASSAYAETFSLPFDIAMIVDSTATAKSDYMYLISTKDQYVYALLEGAELQDMWFNHHARMIYFVKSQSAYIVDVIKLKRMK